MDDVTIAMGAVSAIILAALLIWTPVMVWCDVTDSYADICGPRFEMADGSWKRDYGDE